MARYPDFLFIGAMKSATTNISVQLGLQPGIFMVSNPKELFFFSRDEIYDRGIEWYTSNFDHVPSDELCGEAATTYTQMELYPHSVERMQQHLPNAKLLYLMRNPIDRLISHYMHEVIGGRIKVDINEAIDKHEELVKTSLYSAQLKPYLETFGYEQMMLVFFEKMKATPQAELERICKFIGYTGTPQWQDDVTPKNVSKNRVMQTPLTNFLRYSPILEPVRKYILTDSLKQMVRKPFVSNLERPEITPEKMAYLKSVFDADLVQLGEWVGFDITCDTFSSAVTASEADWNTAAVAQYRAGAQAAAS